MSGHVPAFASRATPARPKAGQRISLNPLSNARHDVDLDDIRREALHDWLNERPPRERPDPSEYEDDPDETTPDDHDA